MLAIERRVCGCDYGGSSWTTRTESELIISLLGLRPGVRLLDLGAGSGWPGLHIAKTSGCDVVLVDLGVLRAGGQSAVGTALSDRIVLVAACGERKQAISTSLELLDRLAPERFLLTLNRAPAPDPLLTPAAAADEGFGRSAGWLKNLLNT